MCYYVAVILLHNKLIIVKFNFTKCLFPYMKNNYHPSPLPKSKRKNT